MTDFYPDGYRDGMQIRDGGGKTFCVCRYKRRKELARVSNLPVACLPAGRADRRAPTGLQMPIS